jgi:hypothetical protein
MTTSGTNSDYPYEHTRAARVLSDAIDVKSDTGISLRQMAGQLGYKSAVVLSHMRTGRLPIPIDRAGEIAKMVGLEPARFLILVLEQRYPDVDFKRAFKKDDEPGAASSLPVGVGVFLKEVEVAAGRSIEKLPAEHLGVIREVAADTRPRRRWVGVSEAGIIELVRQVRPDIAENGLTPDQATALAEALKAAD